MADITSTWQSLMSMLPKYVREITLMVDEQDMTPGDRESLEKLLPGATIRASYTDTATDADPADDTRPQRPVLNTPKERLEFLKGPVVLELSQDQKDERSARNKGHKLWLEILERSKQRRRQITQVQNSEDSGNVAEAETSAEGKNGKKTIEDALEGSDEQKTSKDAANAELGVEETKGAEEREANKTTDDKGDEASNNAKGNQSVAAKTTTTPKKFPRFMQLPAELRLKVYRHYFEDKDNQWYHHPVIPSNPGRHHSGKKQNCDITGPQGCKRKGFDHCARANLRKRQQEFEREELWIVHRNHVHGKININEASFKVYQELWDEYDMSPRKIYGPYEYHPESVWPHVCRSVQDNTQGGTQDGAQDNTQATSSIVCTKDNHVRDSIQITRRGTLYHALPAL